MTTAGPPFDRLRERSVIAALFADPKYFADCVGVREGIFFDADLWKVYCAQVQVHQAGQRVTPDSVLEYLKGQGERGITSAFLSKCVAGVPKKQLDLRARIIQLREIEARRAMHATAAEAMAAAANGVPFNDLRAIALRVPGVFAQQPTSVDSTEAVPELPAACWRHGFIDFRAAYSECTEAPEAFLWSVYLTAAALNIGRGARLACGVEVYPNTYVANVGKSGMDRKTTAQGYGRRIQVKTDTPAEISAGIGSPEGLIQMLSKTNRVLVDLNELSTMLRKGSAEATRGLPPLLTTLYDAPPSVRLPNRQADLQATDPFLCIIGGTTAEWLRRDVTLDDVRGGLAGRFMYFSGKAKAPIPFPPKPHWHALTDAENILVDARARHSELREYALSADAKAIWAGWYLATRAWPYPSPILECLAQRLHLHAWKAALVFAALEGTNEITADQITAAIAFADYQREVQTWAFEGLGDSAQMKVERRVREALRTHGAMPGWKIQQRVRHTSAEDINRAVQSMKRLGEVRELTVGRATLLSLVRGA